MENFRQFLKLNFLLMLFVVPLCERPANGAILAFDSTSNPDANAGDGFSLGIGHLFEVTANIVVDSLVFEGFSGVATDDAVSLQLWNNDTSTLLADYTFSGDSEATGITYAHGSYVGVRHEHAIGGITLNPGTEYVIAAHSLTGIQWISNVSTQTVGAEIDFIQEVAGTVAGDLPTGISAAAGVLRFGGPSFSYSVSAVPEPSGFALTAFGLVSLGLARRLPRRLAALGSGAEV